jgi:hypothetical protein
MILRWLLYPRPLGVCEQNLRVSQRGCSASLPHTIAFSDVSDANSLHQRPINFLFKKKTRSFRLLRQCIDAFNSVSCSGVSVGRYQGVG